MLYKERSIKTSNVCLLQGNLSCMLSNEMSIQLLSNFPSALTLITPLQTHDILLSQIRFPSCQTRAKALENAHFPQLFS